MANDDAELIRAHRPAGAIYRELSFRTITLESWREIVEVAYEEALLGDDRARVWIQRRMDRMGSEPCSIPYSILFILPSCLCPFS